MLAGVILIFGATPKAVAKLIVASVPVAEHPVPVVMLIVPDVSLPSRVIVGVVQDARPSVLVGVVPAVRTWPLFMVRLVLTVRDDMVICMFVLSTDSKVDAEAFWICMVDALSVVGFSTAVLPPIVTAPVDVPVFILVSKLESTFRFTSPPWNVAPAEAVSKPVRVFWPWMDWAANEIIPE